MPKLPDKLPVPDEVAAAQLPSDDEEFEVSHSTNTNRRGLKRNENAPGCWAQGGTLNCYKSVDPAMADMARAEQIAIEELSNKVGRVRATRIRREPSIYIYPVSSDDPDGIEVTRSPKTGRLSINLFDFLATQRLLIPVGKKQRFDLTYVSKAEAPAAIGRACFRLDFSKPLEDKALPKRKSKSKKKAPPPPQPDQTGEQQPGTSDQETK